MDTQENLQPTLSVEDTEILALQTALAASKKRKDEALELQRQKAASALQDRLAAETKKRADDLLEYQAIVAKHEEKKRLAQEAEEAAKREEARKQKALADEAERLEQIQRERAAHAKRCADLAEAARREEMEAEAIQRDLLRTSAPAEEVKPVTIHSPAHPLSRIFGVAQPASAPEPTPAPVEAQLPPELRPISQEEQHLLHSEFQIRFGTPNTTLYLLLRRFTPAEILSAVQKVHDSKLFIGTQDAQRAVELLLWNPSGAE